MKTLHIKARFQLLAVLALAAGSVRAGIGFTEDFNDNSPGPNMSLGTGFGLPTTDFTGAFTVTSGIYSRIYLGTVATDYSTVSFTFDVVVSIPATTNAWAIPFLGMGSTTPRGTFGEPDFPGLYALFVNRNPGYAQYKDGVDTTQTTVVWATGTSLWANATHRLRLEWNATTRKAVFRIDVGNDGGGSFDYSSAEIDGSDNGFTSANSQLYVGGGLGVTFDNIVVTVLPESVPAPVLKISGNGGALDFEWNSSPGKRYDLLSSADLAAPVSSWAVYNDGVTTYGNIGSSATGTNILNGVLKIGSTRFFVLREE